MADPILMSVATTLATKAATGLYDLVKNKLRKNPAAAKALAAADPERPETVRALAERIGAEREADPSFATALDTEWQRLQGGAQHGGVNNQVTGTVHGKVVQAGDIHGDIRF